MFRLTTIKKIACGVLIAIAMCEPVQSQQFLTTNGRVEFMSKASLETFTGVSEHLNGLIDFQTSKVDFYIDLNTIRTGITLRDEHMRETYLETKKFPFAEFNGNINGLNVARRDTQNVIVTGQFSIHGVSKNVTIRGRVLYNGQELYIEASWSVLLSDHNIAIPKVMFLKLADSQEVSINATLKQKD